MRFLMLICRDESIPFSAEDRGRIGSQVQAWVTEMQQRGVRCTAMSSQTSTRRRTSACAGVRRRSTTVRGCRCLLPPQGSISSTALTSTKLSRCPPSIPSPGTESSSYDRSPKAESSPSRLPLSRRGSHKAAAAASCARRPGAVVRSATGADVHRPSSTVRPSWGEPALVRCRRLCVAT